MNTVRISANFSKNLWQHLLGRNMSAGEFAGLVGISMEQVRTLLAGPANTSVSVHKALQLNSINLNRWNNEEPGRGSIYPQRTNYSIEWVAPTPNEKQNLQAEINELRECSRPAARQSWWRTFKAGVRAWWQDIFGGAL